MTKNKYISLVIYFKQWPICFSSNSDCNLRPQHVNPLYTSFPTDQKSLAFDLTTGCKATNKETSDDLGAKGYCFLHMCTPLYKIFLLLAGKGNAILITVSILACSVHSPLLSEHLARLCLLIRSQENNKVCFQNMGGYCIQTAILNKHTVPL